MTLPAGYEEEDNYYYCILWVKKGKIRTCVIPCVYSTDVRADVISSMTTVAADLSRSVASSSRRCVLNQKRTGIGLSRHVDGFLHMWT